jgi:Bromodomain
VNAHKFAAIFRKAVNEKDAPGYKKIVKEPMDLGLIRDRVQSGQIQSFDEVRHFAATSSITVITANLSLLLSSPALLSLLLPLLRGYGV